MKGQKHHRKPVDAAVSTGETEIIYGDKLESLSILAGGIAHDFNNLLTAILGNIALSKSCPGVGDAAIVRMDEAEKVAVDQKVRHRIQLMRKNWKYCVLIHDYLKAIVDEQGDLSALPWAGAISSETLDKIEKKAKPLAEKIRAYLKNPENRGAVCGITNYETLLLNPRHVASAWGYRTDRGSSIVLDKVRWLKSHPDERAKAPDSKVAIWI